MQITQDIRKYAEEHGVGDWEAIELGMKEKSVEFVDTGAEVYRP
jgi:phosphomethylpyrimidine synthase